MKSNMLAFAAISVLAVFSPTYGIADEATVTATPAAEAVDSDAVLHRAREAIQRLETACLNHDQSGIAGAVTQDVVAEYALPEPGEYLALDASALDKHCAVATPSAQSKQISNLWVYPTWDSSSCAATVLQRFNTRRPHQLNSSASPRYRPRASNLKECMP